MANQDRRDDDFSDPMPEPFPGARSEYDDRSEDSEPVPVGAATSESSASQGGSGPEPTSRRPFGPGGRARRDRAEAGGAAGGTGETAKLAVRRARELLATAVLTVAVLAALMLALGALLVGLHANENNQIVAAVIDFGHRLVGPFADVFTFRDTVKQTLVNWGIAAAVYLIAGRIVERVIRP